MPADAVATRRLFGVMCTYRRPEAVAIALEAIADQSLPLDLLVVVDNDDDPEVRRIVESQTSVTATYLGVRPNGGPAGAFNIGLLALPEPVSPAPHHPAPVSSAGARPELTDDLVVLFDDDDPPVAEESIERLVERLDDLTAKGARIGGIGLHGGVLDVGRGLVRPPAGSCGVVPVDHLHGGYLPVYRRSALAEIGGFDPQLFWGFEELDLGLRMTARGHGLVVDMDQWQAVSELYPKAQRRKGVRLTVSEPSPGRYYSLRNLLRVLARLRAWRAIASIVAVRAVGKPLLGMVVRPRIAVAGLAVNVLAVVDAARGRMGRRDHFPAVCSLSTQDPAPGRLREPTG